MKIVVIAAGYVGISVGVLFSLKNEVKLLEVDNKKVDLINNKVVPFQDEQIQKYLSTNDLKLIATNDENVIKDAHLIVIAVPTDYDSNKHFFDTSILESVLKKIELLNNTAVVVIKSTVPIGYTEKACKVFNIPHLLFSPEFLREGKALYDNLHPSRIIVGIPFNNKSEHKNAELFASLLKESCLEEDPTILIMGSTEAESVKLFSNTYLAMRISFFNELDTFSIIKNLDSKKIIQGVCLDPRIGDFYNNPSFGYGGYCLPKDTKQLLANYDGIPQEIITSIVNANNVRKEFIAKFILDKNVRILGIYRLTMKNGSDNFRSSSILDIINYLIQHNLEVIIFEPTLQTDNFLNLVVDNDLESFKSRCDLIVANRYDDSLADIKDKLFTRDLFFRD